MDSATPNACKDSFMCAGGSIVLLFIYMPWRHIPCFETHQHIHTDSHFKIPDVDKYGVLHEVRVLSELQGNICV